MIKKENTKNIKKKSGRKKNAKRRAPVDEFEDFDEFEEDIDPDELGDTMLRLAEELDDEVLCNALRSAVRRRRNRLNPPSPESLTGKCLVYIGDPSNEAYNQAVVFITDSDSEYVHGIMVNKLMFNSAVIECRTRDNKTTMHNVYDNLYQGGPENQAHGAVIFPTKENLHLDPISEVFGDISVSTSLAMLQAIMEGNGPNKKIIALGHCVWRLGELEWELFNNQWLIIPSSEKLLFDTNYEDRWEFAKKESGVYRGTYITHQIGLA